MFRKSNTSIRSMANGMKATDSAEATQPLKRWLDEHPDDQAMRSIYAQALQASGDMTSAVSEYEKIVSDDTMDAVALNNLAWQYAEEGRAGALELAERAYELQPDSGNIADTLGWIVYRQGDLPRALDLLRKAAQLSENNPEIQFHLAKVLAESGEVAEAEAILTTLLRDNGEFSSRKMAQELAEEL